ncbi:LysR family transcriptional regulator [uncultured Hyphomonas sp.]|uniref:LysR family transcriptional regulator n=1 Tax=uncultured Hyphomonas sp. TaxID=225298 RepID=UPI002AAB789A|nr:LysR family transcriptional regulator [uncultured Hyphomonas sp.]
MDRIDAMRLFVRVADAGSFSRAAADLGIGQPTVSRRIQDLEGQLDAMLFLRTTRALSLTEAGERFYRRAVDILAEYDEAEAEARGLEHEPVGLLRISCSHSFARHVIAPEIASFMRIYPHVKFDVIGDDFLTDIVGEGVDLAFRLGELTDSSLMAKKLAEAPRALWASPAYLERKGTPQTPADLARHDALIFRHSRSTIWTLTNGNQKEDVTVDGPFRASGGEILQQAAEDGLGILMAPGWLVSNCLGSNTLVRVLPEWETQSLSIHAVWAAGKLRGKAKLFADHLADSLKSKIQIC